uniref:Large ribosomal subunit protein mL42 n=1 Tax=Oryctolagus cuniculus TaxID=9986 RepID=A0A5F9DBM8_RABIT
MIRTILKHLSLIQNGAFYCFAIILHMFLFQITLMQIRACFAIKWQDNTMLPPFCGHPSEDIHTKPIPLPDPVLNNEETHDQALKNRFEEKSKHLEQGPMVEQLRKTFFSTKHHWYPHLHYHRDKKLHPGGGGRDR